MSNEADKARRLSKLIDELEWAQGLVGGDLSEDEATNFRVAAREAWTLLERTGAFSSLTPQTCKSVCRTMNAALPQ